MLESIAILLCMAFCAGEPTPTLWGSRVVGKPSGPSDVMTYAVSGDTDVIVYTATELDRLTIDNGNCMVNGTVWGTPCQKGNDTINIALKDVTMQKRMEVYSISYSVNYVLTTFFVPHCKFPPPEPGQVDLKTSFPLSRFVKDQQVFPIDFAVEGANSEEEVLLGNIHRLLCAWKGVNLITNNSEVCTNLERNETSNMRVFHGKFPTQLKYKRDVFIWQTNRTILSVSVDYTQSGTSPEVAECNSPVLTSKVGVLLGTALLLTCLRS
ncbi:hypothetical protein TcWFU_009427 [Taenia crassiceps]|uniref:DUF5727 domain-containing protein n=1 Tax=Taenia crassiceps TaxID=6207 RepID=A0ABR4Q839_9CEST